MRPRMPSLLSTTFALTLCCTLSCSSLLYHPDHVMYVEQEMMEYKPEDQVLPLASGGEVHSWYFAAPGKPKGVVVFFHGNGENRTSHIVDVYWMVKAGYDLLAVEYPGYGETDGSPTPKNTVEAGHAALRYAARRNPGLPLIVYGHSLGGAVALRTVLDMKKEVPVALVVAADTFLSYRRAGQRVLARAWITWPVQWLPWLVLSDEYAPGKNVADLSPTQLVVIHYDDDPLIPFDLGQEIYETAQTSKELWTLNGREHNSIFYGARGLPVRERLLKKLAEFHRQPAD